MKKTITKIIMFAAVITAFASCTAINHNMKSPNTLVNLDKSDFTLSEQLTAEATSTKICGIDFARIFKSKTGSIEGGGAGTISVASIPVIGNFVGDKTANYSLYNLMDENPGYDVVFYPQYETRVIKPILGIGIITTITTVKTTARLGKLNK